MSDGVEHVPGTEHFPYSLSDQAIRAELKGYSGIDGMDRRQLFELWNLVAADGGIFDEGIWREPDPGSMLLRSSISLRRLERKPPGFPWIPTDDDLRRAELKS